MTVQTVNSMFSCYHVIFIVYFNAKEQKTEAPHNWFPIGSQIVELNKRGQGLFLKRRDFAEFIQKFKMRIVNIVVTVFTTSLLASLQNRTVEERRAISRATSANIKVQADKRVKSYQIRYSEEQDQLKEKQARKIRKGFRGRASMHREDRRDFDRRVRTLQNQLLYGQQQSGNRQ